MGWGLSWYTRLSFLVLNGFIFDEAGLIGVWERIYKLYCHSIVGCESCAATLLLEFCCCDFVSVRVCVCGCVLNLFLFSIRSQPRESK